MSCYWTPENLIDDDLYALWVTNTNTDGEAPQWALSPPWKLTEPVRYPFTPTVSL